MTRFLALFSCLIPVLVSSTVAQEAAPNTRARHPIVSTPEATLTAILSGYVARDPDVVLAHVHPLIQRDPDRMARWRDIVRDRLTDRVHVGRIVEVRLVGITTRKQDKVATLIASVETTATFGGGTDLGGNIHEYHWSLVQLNGKGPWYHDGGGF